jgi:hypothetical protein
MQKYLIIFLSLILVVSHQACSPQNSSSGLQGTDTGNVLSPAEFETVLVSNLCQRIHDCQAAAPMDSCQIQVAAITGLPKKFGVPDSKNINTMADLYQAEMSSEVSGDALKHISCVSDILAMPCSNPSLQNAYNPGTHSFDGVSSFVLPTGDCQSLY